MELTERIQASNLARSAYLGYMTAFLAVTNVRPLGTSIWRDDWDLCVVLDACRVDTLRTVASDYDWLDADAIGSRWSVGSNSPEWMANTFTEPYADHIDRTAYLTANGFVDGVLSDDQWRTWGALSTDTWLENATWLRPLLERDCVNREDFADVEVLWDGRVPHPRAVVRAAIAYHRRRTGTPDRTVLHLMQPHAPYFEGDRRPEELSKLHEEPIKMLRRGDASRREVLDAYERNLRTALDAVSLLRQNIDADRVVITADHAELFGSPSELGICGHLPGFPHPTLRKVPWTVTDATDQATVGGDDSLLGREQSERDTEAQLEALGYK